MHEPESTDEQQVVEETKPVKKVELIEDDDYYGEYYDEQQDEKDKQVEELKKQ